MESRFMARFCSRRGRKNTRRTTTNRTRTRARGRDGIANKGSGNHLMSRWTERDAQGIACMLLRVVVGGIHYPLARSLDPVFRGTDLVFVSCAAPPPLSAPATSSKKSDRHHMARLSFLFLSSGRCAECWEGLVWCGGWASPSSSLLSWSWPPPSVPE